MATSDAAALAQLQAEATLTTSGKKKQAIAASRAYTKNTKPAAAKPATFSVRPARTPMQSTAPNGAPTNTVDASATDAGTAQQDSTQGNALDAVPVPKNQPVPTLRPTPSYFKRATPIARDAAKEDATLQQILQQQGITDLSKASLAKQQLIKESVNEQVYGNSYPVFKQQAPAAAPVVASPPPAPASSTLPPQPLTSVVTSDEARSYTDDQLKDLNTYQERSNVTAGESVDSLLDTDPDVLAAQQSGEDMQGMLEQRRTFYKGVYDDTLQRIKDSYDTSIADAKTAGNQEVAQSINMLVRMGAYGTTTAGVQYISDQQRANDAKIMAFSAEEAASIQKAYEAYQDADFTTAQSMIDNAKSVREEIRTIKSNAIDTKIKTAQLQQLEQEGVQKTVDNIVKAGMTADDLPPDYLEHLDNKQGLPFGTTKKLMDVALQEKQAKEATDAAEQHTKAIDNAQKLVSVLKDLPPGQSITIDGTDYDSLSTGDVTTGTETDTNGGVTLYSYNKTTGEVMTRSLGNIGKASGWERQTDNNGNIVAINPTTGEMRMIYNASVPDASNFDVGGVYDAFPEGADGGQCGAFVEGLCGDLGYITPKKNKFALIDQGIGKVQGQGEEPSAGMLFVQDIGTYGHIGLVNRVTPLPDGSYQLDVIDSNSKGDEKVHYRTINSRSVKGFVPASLKDQYQFGTDGGTQLDFSQKGAAENLSASDKLSLKKTISGDNRVSQFVDLNRSFNAMQASLDIALSKKDSKSKASSDQALIVLFNKMLDPNSVVREGEYDRTGQGQSLLQQAESYVAKLKQGGAGITDQTRKDMVEVAKSLLNISSNAYATAVDEYSGFIPSSEDSSKYLTGYSDYLKLQDTNAGNSDEVDTLKQQYPNFNIDALMGLKKADGSSYSIAEIQAYLKKAVGY